MRLEAALQAQEGGGLPDDGDLSGAVQCLEIVHRSLRCRREGRRGQGHVGLPQGAAEVLERRDGLHPGDPGRLGGDGLQLTRCRPGGVDHQAGGGLGEGGELALDQLIGGSGRTARRQAARIGPGEGDVEERGGQDDEDQECGQGPQSGPAHHDGGDPVPASRCLLTAPGGVAVAD